jgi:hypothetical protein
VTYFYSFAIPYYDIDWFVDACIDEIYKVLNFCYENDFYASAFII